MRSYLENLRTAVLRNDPDGDTAPDLKLIEAFFVETQALSGQSAAGLRVDAPFARELARSSLLQLQKGTAKPETERFLQGWFDGIVRHTSDGLPGLLRQKAGLTTDADLFDLLAAAMLLLLKNADDNWDALYIQPLKKALRQALPGLKAPSLSWKQQEIDTIPGEVLQQTFYALPKCEPLRQAMDYNEAQLRCLLGLVNNAMINGYLALGKNYINAGLPEKWQAAFKKGRYEIRDMLAPVAEVLRSGGVASLLYCGKTSFTTAAGDRSPRKVQQRLLRYLLFALLSTRERVYGTLWDHREVLIQLGFGLQMNSRELDDFLRRQGQPGS